MDDQEGTEKVLQNASGAERTIIGAQPKLGRFAHHGQGFWLAVSDWKVWWLMVAFTSQVTALSFNAFFPTLGATLNLGSTAVTLIAIAPPWFLAAVVAFLNSRYANIYLPVSDKLPDLLLLHRHSDKQGERFYHIFAPLVIGLIGFIIAMSTMNTAARYISL